MAVLIIPFRFPLTQNTIRREVRHVLNALLSKTSLLDF